MALTDETDEAEKADEAGEVDEAHDAPVATQDAGWLGGAVRPLRLAALPAELQPLAMTAVVAIAGWCFALVLTAVGSGVQFDPRLSSDGLMGGGGVGPALVRIATGVSVGIVVAMATSAAWGPGWTQTRPAVVGRHLVRLAVVVVGLFFVVHFAVHWRTFEPVGEETRGDLLRLVWSSGLGWAVMVAVVASLFLSSSSATARRLAVPLAVLPVGAWLVAEVAQGTLTRAWESNADWRNDVLLNLVNSLQLMLVLFLVWELVAWTELVADGSAFLARQLPAGRRVLVALLAAKVIWLGAGLAGALPGFLGGHASAWVASTEDGVGSWVLGGVLAVLAVVAIVHVEGPTRETALAWMPLLVIVVVLVGPGVVAGALDVVRVPLGDALPLGLVDLVQVVVVLLGAVVAATVLTVVDTVSLASRRTLLLIAVNACVVMGYFAAVLQHFAESGAIVRFQENLPFPETYPLVPGYGDPGLVTAHYFLAPGVAFAVAVTLAVRWRQGGGWVVPTVFAAALGGVALLYVLPHLPQFPLEVDRDMLGAGGDQMAPHLSYNVYPLREAGWTEGWNGVPGTFEPVTFDALLTVGLCWLAWRWWRVDDHGRWRLLSFVLLASTVLAHSSTIRPDGWLGNHWYYAAFVVPVVWQLVVRGDDLNQLVRRHPSLALLNLALVLLLMTVIGYRLLTGALDPTVDLQEAVFPYGRGLTLAVVLVPLGAVAVRRHLRLRPT